jgi:hypothetical protein
MPFSHILSVFWLLWVFKFSLVLKPKSFPTGSWGSSVRNKTSYRLDAQGLFHGRDGGFPPIHHVFTGSGDYQAFYS